MTSRDLNSSQLRLYGTAGAWAELENSANARAWTTPLLLEHLLRPRPRPTGPVLGPTRCTRGEVSMHRDLASSSSPSRPPTADRAGRQQRICSPTKAAEHRLIGGTGTGKTLATAIGIGDRLARQARAVYSTIRLVNLLGGRRPQAGRDAANQLMHLASGRPG